MSSIVYRCGGLWLGLAAVTGVVAAPTASALQGDPPSQQVWSYAVSDWMPASASLGDMATQVFTARGGYGDQTKLFSSFDNDPPNPAWQSSEHPGLTMRHVVDSASDADVHVNLRLARTSTLAPNRVHVEKYSSSTAAPDWIYEFPFDVTSIYESGIDVSDDGEVIVAWVYRDLNTGTLVAVWHGGNPIPVVYDHVQLWSSPRSVDVSADGSTLYLGGHTRSAVMNVEPWAELYYGLSTDALDFTNALSADGSVFAQSTMNGTVRVFERSGDEYSLLFSHQAPEGSEARPSQLALSGNARWFACAFDLEPEFLDVRLQILDLEGPGRLVVFEEVVQGQGEYTNAAQEIALSMNGETFAAGLWGDEAGLADEVRVYRRSAGQWALAFTHDLPGSVTDLDLSPDGRRVVVASKSVHANVLSSGGSIALYETIEPDLTVHGVPSIGSRVTLVHALPPGELSRMMYARSPQDPPIPFPGVGTLYIDRSDVHVIGNAPADSEGVASMELEIPNDPDLIGTTMYLQGLQAAPRRLSRDWVKLTILP